jgi:hypothetical protein
MAQASESAQSSGKSAASGPKEKVYFARAKRCQIGGYVKEVRNGSMIDRSEEPLEITGNILVTADPKMQKHIEQSRAFRNGHDVVLCKDLMEAQERRAVLLGQRAKAELKAEYEGDGEDIPDVALTAEEL